MKNLFFLIILFFACHILYAQSIVKGLVFEDTNRNGKKDKREKRLSGISVSNGVEVVKTDENGRYELPIGDDNIIFVVKPAGYQPHVNGNNLPQYYYIHKPNGSPDLTYEGVAPTGELPKSVDFALVRAEEKETFTTLIFGDPQVRNEEDVDYFSRGIISEVENIEGVTFGMSLGDLTGNQLNLFKPYAEEVKKIGIPWYNVMGNHDINFDVKEDILSDETFEAHFGPTTYSFNYGDVHFIVLDDILYKDPRSDRRVDGGFREDQLKFVENNLKHVSTDKLIVLSFHIPLYNLKEKYRQQIFDLLERFPDVLTLSGHAHQQRQVFFKEEDGWKQENPLHEYNVGTASGNWYGGLHDERGIPVSTMKDGTPMGYAFITFTGNKYTIDYKAANKPQSYRMRISAPKVVAHEARENISMYVNYFMGSKEDTLWYRVDNGDWKMMEYAPGPDRAYLYMLHQYYYSDSLLPGRCPGNPVNSTHIWKAPVPTSQSPGNHTIEVKVRDMFGRTFTQKSNYRIEVPEFSIR